MVVVVRLANELGGEGASRRLQLRLGDLPGALRGARRADRHQRLPRLAARAADGDPAGFDGLAASDHAGRRAGVGAGGRGAGGGRRARSRVFLEGTPGGGARGRWPGPSRCSRPAWSDTGSWLTCAGSCTPAGRGRAAAAASVVGWGVAIVAQIVLAQRRPPSDVVGQLALGSTVGMTVGGVLLVVRGVRARGAAALDGAWRALLAAVAGGVAAWGAGLAVATAFGEVARWACVAVGVAAAVVGAVGVRGRGRR